MATTTSLPAPDAQTQPAISPVGRITGVFFSPKATFEDIVRKPSWVLPVVLLTLFSIGVSFAINQRINWREFMSQQIEKSPQAASMSAEQKEQRIEGGAKFSPPFTYAIGVLGPIIFVLVVALVMWGAYNLLGGANTNFGTSFAITAHAALTGLVNSLLYILVLYLKPPGTVDLENPVATNLGALLPDGTAKWLTTLGTAIDLFSFWIMALIAMGFAAFNPKKIKMGSAFGIVLSVWAVYEAIRVGFAFI